MKCGGRCLPHKRLHIALNHQVALQTLLSFTSSVHTLVKGAILEACLEEALGEVALQRAAQKSVSGTLQQVQHVCIAPRDTAVLLKPSNSEACVTDSTAEVLRHKQN